MLENNLSELKSLSDDKKAHVLKGLSALAKFLGIYEDFKAAVKNYGITWAGRSKDDIVIERMTKIQDPGEVYAWIREVKRARPEIADLMDLMAITGMRLVEAIDSYNLIVKLSRAGKLGEYYNAEKGILEHFKYKETFIRNTKKTFISFVPKDLVERIEGSKPIPSANSILKMLQRSGIRCRFGDIREAHATFLTKYLQQPEIDFLHGRVSTNVFMRNYFNPALIADLKTRAFQGIQEIEEKIA